MNEGYSDDETLELQDDDQSNQHWSANTSSERIRRSCASTDIAALMDTEMDEGASREEEEHTEELPARLIAYYRDKFNANAASNRWTPPIMLDDRFRDLLNKAVRMCETGRADGTVDSFIGDNLSPLFRKWYYSGEGADHWPGEIYLDIGETLFKVIKMLRGLIVAGAGARDIAPVLWELVYHISLDHRTNLGVGERIYQMSVEVDESAEVDLVKPEHQHSNAPMARFVRTMILIFDAEGFKATQKFFADNITVSTSVEELCRYLKAFKLMNVVLNADKAYATFASIVYNCIDRIMHAPEQEQTCKNLRGPLETHPLFGLYQLIFQYADMIREHQGNNHIMMQLFRWRLRFCLKALNEAPFNGRMGAVESMAYIVNDFSNNVGGTSEQLSVLMKWMEEERAVDYLTRDNLHNQSYVDRVQRVFDQFLRVGIFTTADLSTVWEAQRGKHDAIQRNLADLIIHIVPHFDNDLLEALFHKIQAGWVDGGVKERETLIEIVRKIGEQSAGNFTMRRPTECDQALIDNSLSTLWKFIRHPGTTRDNEETALQAHLKLLEDSRVLNGYMKSYAELCSADIQKENDMSATAASHLVHILELVSDDDEDDDEEYATSVGRQDLIGCLEGSHKLVRSLCANIAKCVQRTDEAKARRDSLRSFLNALSFVLNQNRHALHFSEQHASDLWKALIAEPAHEQDKKIGFKFFMEVVDMMDKVMLVRFFNEYVLKRPPEAVSEDGFMCFEAFFKAVNDGNGVMSTDRLVGVEYVRQLILLGQSEVCDRASNLWVDYMQKMIDHAGQPEVTAEHVQNIVRLITEQYDEVGAAVHEALNRGMSPTVNPFYEMAKERTLRCIKLLNGLISCMDEEVCVARRGEPSLAQSAVGRPLYVCGKVTRREWESVPYTFRGSMRADDLETGLDTHDNITVAELRESLKQLLINNLTAADRSTRRKQDSEELLEQFLIVFLAPEGPRTLRFADYKRTLAEAGMADAAEVEIRLNKRAAVGRLGDGSPDTSTSESDWISPEDLGDDREKESILPSLALAADEGMVDRLLSVCESGDMDIAMSAFRLLKMVPQNGAKLHQLYQCLEDEAKLRELLESSHASRFLYYLMMLEAIILPADPPKQTEYYRQQRDLHKLAITAMIMLLRVLPHVATLSHLMERSAAFRSLAIISITHMLHIICMTTTRVVVRDRWGKGNDIMKPGNDIMKSMVNSLMRLNHVDLPAKSSRYVRLRRLSSTYADILEPAQARQLLLLVEQNAAHLQQLLCGVVLAGSAITSPFNAATSSPMAAESASVLARTINPQGGGGGGKQEPLLDDTTMLEEQEVGTIPALLECSVYAIALLAASCPRQSAQFIGAARHDPDPLWVHTVVAATFHRADNVRLMAWNLIVEMVEVVRASIIELGDDADIGHVSLTSALLDLLPACERSDKCAEHFVALVKECIHRAKSWCAQIVRLDEHIMQGVQFLESALLHSTAQQTPFPDETYLRARIEVLQKLMSYTSPAQREALGSAPDGPRLSERLLADFIFPAARATEAAAISPAAAGGGGGDVVMFEADASLPRSVTHMEMNSSSSLFELTGGGAASLPRSLSALPAPSTRRVAVCSGEGSQEGVFHLLLALCGEVPANQVLMQTTIHRLFYSNPWTDKKDFDYLPQHILRAEGDLVGLKNGGATCYMNSIFQQLFMIDEVREAVLNVTIPEKVLLERRCSDSSTPGEAGRGDYAVKVLAAVQSLFAHLLGSELESYRPAEFWKVFAFKPNGESVNVREQQDAVEFHNMVTELIDEGLKKCGSEAMCEKTFRGVFADEKICKDCPHRYTKEEPFESLSLDVRSHNNLRDSLKEYVKGDVLENDNAYHCELCNKKVKAIKRLSLSKLPEVLIVQLKRFDFDWEKEISVKFNDYFEFPFEIDIQPYTVDGLEKLEKGEPLEIARDYLYSLRGVVVHSGQAQGGHYTSYIRNRETGKWFKFDDNDVTPWEATENGAQQRWFGCTDGGLDSMGRGKRKIRTTYWNAYMLFYEKLETANRYLSANPSSVGSDMSTSSGVSSMTTTMTAIVSSAVSSSSNVNLSACASPTPSSSGTVTSSTITVPPTATAAGSGGTASPTPIKMARTGGGSGRTSQSPVSNLHRHFSSLSLSSARIRMPPLLEEMLRDGNRRVQLERVQYSTHYFSFVSAATAKALTTADLVPECAEELLLATMKSFASFIVHNGLFASRELMSGDEGLQKCSFKSWQVYMKKLLRVTGPRTWFITHVLFSHEIAACFLFASDVNVRGFFQTVILDTMMPAEVAGDASEVCLRPPVTSPLAGQLAQSLRQFPRLSHLLAHLLGMLPFKHNSAFRSEPINFYRTITELAASREMVIPLVRGGILNNLLVLFSPVHMSSDLSSLQRRDARVYEEVHMVVASLLRTIRWDEGTPVDRERAQYCDEFIVVRRSEMPDLKVLTDFMQPDGGHVKFLQHLVELLRRATRATPLSWALGGALYVCYDHPTASAVVMDAVCQNLGTLMSETATQWLIALLNNVLMLKDGRAEARYEHIFYKVQLTSTHAHPSVQGLLEYEKVNESRYEAILRILSAAVEYIPGVEEMIKGDERVLHLLAALNTIAAVKANTSRHAQAFHAWFEAKKEVLCPSEEAAAESASDSTMAEDSTMDDVSRSDVSTSGDKRPSAMANYDRVSSQSSPFSAGQLSPSARLNALTLSTGDKRPLPPTEEGEEADAYSADRKRSIGETMMRTGGSGASATDADAEPSSSARGGGGASWVTKLQTSPPAGLCWPKLPKWVESFADAAPHSPPLSDDDFNGSSPMDDSALLISSSSPSTSNRVPSVPPPAYSELASTSSATAASTSKAVRGPPPPRPSPLSPPPVPPRPAARAAAAAAAAARTWSPSTDDEFVERSKQE